MKTASTIALVCLLILIAGCASDQRQASRPAEPTYPGDVSSASPDRSDADRALANVARAQFDRYGALATLAQNIQISAGNGTVTLTGSVPGEQEKKMIHAMIENTKGVLAVENHMRVSGSPILPFNQSDRALATRVRQALLDKPIVAPYVPNLEISVDSGIVTLSGSVASEADRQFIESTVKNTTGVAGVIDRIQAPLQPTGRSDQSARTYSADAGEIFSLHVQALNETDRSVAQRILQGLRTDTALTALLPVVNINVADGKMTLRGTVQTDEQKRAVVSAVQRAAGDGSVFDELQVQQPR
jgi:osmotically-inducible protein OsmY